jgi:holliday junction DNA helicase RuvA
MDGRVDLRRLVDIGAGNLSRPRGRVHVAYNGRPMIWKIHGVLESLAPGSARVAPGDGLTYEVLLPAYAASRLGAGVGRPVTLHTVYYLEGSSQGGNFIPRLAGFLSEVDREFFALFTSVKGIGSRKALRAMALSTEQIAAAVADRDIKTLQSLPEIGRRMAETIIATLHGKVDRFIAQGAYTTASGNGWQAAPTRSAAREALEILLQLGENRVTAMQWIDQVLVKDPSLEDATRVVQEVLRLKAGA